MCYPTFTAPKFVTISILMICFILLSFISFFAFSLESLVSLGKNNSRLPSITLIENTCTLSLFMLSVIDASTSQRVAANGGSKGGARVRSKLHGVLPRGRAPSPRGAQYRSAAIRSARPLPFFPSASSSPILSVAASPIHPSIHQVQLRAELGVCLCVVC